MLGVLVTLAMTASVSAAEQEDLPWESKPYPYTIVSQPVRDALVNFGYNAGLRIMVPPHVAGLVQGFRSEGSAKDFIDEITKTNDLDWYSDGNVIYVSPASEEQTAIVSLNGFSFDVMKKELEVQKLFDARYRMSKQIGGGAAILSGPPSFVAVLKQAIEARVGDGNASATETMQALVVLRGSQSSRMNVR